jgi:hypothetical protein
MALKSFIPRSLVLVIPTAVRNGLSINPMNIIHKYGRARFVVSRSHQLCALPVRIPIPSRLQVSLFINLQMLCYNFMLDDVSTQSLSRPQKNHFYYMHDLFLDVYLVCTNQYLVAPFHCTILPWVRYRSKVCYCPSLCS